MEVAFHVPRLQLRTQEALLQLADWLAELCLTPDIDCLPFTVLAFTHPNRKNRVRDCKMTHCEKIRLGGHRGRSKVCQHGLVWEVPEKNLANTSLTTGKNNWEASGSGM